MESEKRVMSKLIAAMKKNKKIEIAVYAAVAICVILLCIVTGGKEKGGSDKSAEVQVVAATEEQIEERLSTVLSEIRGAGKVKVMITYDTTAELVPAMSSAKQSSETNGEGSKAKNENESNQPATVNTGGGQEPIVIKEIQPKVRGVIVIAEGAADISVKMSLEYATATVLGIDRDSIEVFEMEGDNQSE